MTKVTVYNTTDVPLPLETCTVFGREETSVDDSDSMLAAMTRRGYLIVREPDTKPQKNQPRTKKERGAQESATTPGEYQDSIDVTKGN